MIYIYTVEIIMLCLADPLWIEIHAIELQFQFQFISLSTDPLQGQRPHGYRNSQTI